MAIYGSSRDISLFRNINRELLQDVITQQVALYKVNIEKTSTNMYGEVTGKRFFTEPTLLNCLIKRTDPNFSQTNIGEDYNRVNTFSFLRDDLVDAKIKPELGDFIMYYNDYYEIEQSFDNQLFVGKDPDYNYSENPLNPGLEEYGSSISINCVGRYIPADKISLSRER